MGLVAWLLLSGLLAVPPDAPRLRHAATVVFLPAGPEASLHLRSVPHGTFGDGVRYRLVWGDNQGPPEEFWLDLGQESTTSLTGLPAGKLCALLLDSGWNLLQVALDAVPWAVAAPPARAVTTVGEATWQMWQPAGVAGQVTVSASVTGEGCRVVLAAGEQLLADETGDFDQPRRLALPAVDQPRVVTLRVLKPAPGQRLNLDDVEVSLAGGLTPYLAPTPEAAEILGRRWLSWSSSSR